MLDKLSCVVIITFFNGIVDYTLDDINSRVQTPVCLQVHLKGS